MNETGTSRLRGDLVLAFLLVLLFGALAVAVRQALGPLPLGLAALYLLYPYRGQPLTLRLLLVVIMFLALWILRRLGPVLSPLFVAFILAYFLDPLVARLARRGVPRSLAAAIPLVIVLAAAVLIFVFVVPPLVSEALDLVGQLPTLLQEAAQRVDPLLRRWGARFGTEGLLERSLPRLSDALRQIVSKLQGGMTLLGRGLQWLFALLSFLILTPVLTFYLLRDFTKIRAWIAGVVPLRWQSPAGSMAEELDTLLSKYLRGQAISAALVGLEAIVALSLLRIPYALALGALTGLMNFVPIVGFWISFVSVVLVVLLGHDPWMGLLRLVPVYVGIQFLDSYVVAPRVVGQRVGLHPAIILLAVLAFPIYFGVFGVLIAVPAVAVISVLLRGAMNAYRASEFYRASPPKS
jgi:predicted PurR-regulated permease PerM